MLRTYSRKERAQPIVVVRASSPEARRFGGAVPKPKSLFLDDDEEIEEEELEQEKKKDDGAEHRARTKEVFALGAKEDRELVASVLVKDKRISSVRVPGDWSFEQQDRIINWVLQMRGEFKYKGGYVELIFSPEITQTIRSLDLAKIDSQEAAAQKLQEKENDLANQRNKLQRNTKLLQDQAFLIQQMTKLTIQPKKIPTIQEDLIIEEEEDEFEDAVKNEEMENKSDTAIKQEKEEEEEDGEVNDLENQKFSMRKSIRPWQRYSISATLLNGRHDSLGESKLEGSKQKQTFETWKHLISEFPVGEVIGHGSYKEVFKVWNHSHKRVEAMSIMNIDEISELGNPAVIEQEVSVSLVLSELIQKKICPNFIEIYQIFKFDFPPPSGDAWSQKIPTNFKLDVLPPLGAIKKPRKGHFQYIRMEFCNEGDLEELVKRQPDQVFPIEEVRVLVFQMLFSLFTSRSHVSLRHYDIKLLNFFVVRREESTRRRFGLLGKVFQFESKLLLKLGDYGTADIDRTNIGKPITVDHFTTLENTPIDFLLHPDAVQSYNADNFALGLAVLHLFTGGCPYEEIMVDVKCPEALFKALEEVWTDKNKGFDALNIVLENDENSILYHTLYRFVVLFGYRAKCKSQFGPCGQVWDTVQRVLGVGSYASSRSMEPEINNARVRFRNDRDVYALSDGTHPLISRSRNRLESADGAWDLLQSLIQFDPELRPQDLRDCLLKSPFFRPLVLQHLETPFDEEYGAP